MPTWSGCHALLSTSNIPLMRVGYLPMIPSPVTDYATVRKALMNFQSVRHQLNSSQSVIPVFCDEGVFHTLADILMAEPDTFPDIHGMMGMFHWAKVLLKCAGRYLTGSGIEDGLIETEVFGKLTLNSVLEGTHYVRSFQGICIVSDVITSLMWEAFWLWVTEHEVEISEDTMSCAKELMTALSDRSRSKSIEKFSELYKKCGDVYNIFKSFVKECESKSEVCQYWSVFLQVAQIIKHVISADREGNFPLHIAAVEKSLPIFQESDAINYLRYGSFYLESMKLLKNSHPEVYKRFEDGYFVVKDRVGSFNAVSPDMKLEQSIQRASKNKGGIVGQTRKTAVVIEWQLIFHEILLISNNLRLLTNDSSMDHSESAQVHHDLIGQKAEFFNRNVGRLLDFVSSRGNPYIIPLPGIKLHNFVTKQIAHDDVSARLRHALVNGHKCYQEFRKERFLDKKKKLSATISKRNLLTMDYNPHNETTAPAACVSDKILAAAQRNIDILKQRGMSMESIFSYDFLPSSIIFEGNLASKSAKSKLMPEIEKFLKPEDMTFPQGSEAVIIVDFMSRIRSFCNLSSFGTIGNAIRCVLSTGQSLCSPTCIHIVFDSYRELSIKSGERMRRTGGTTAIDMTLVSPDVPIPKQMDKFWPSPSNKTQLQRLTRVVAKEQRIKVPIILSGCVVDDEIVPAELIESESLSGNLSHLFTDVLNGVVEEADDRLLLHCAWEVARGCKRLVVISNDTDTVVRLLRFTREWQESGMLELWVEFGAGEHRRHLPLHILVEKLGYDLSRVLVKVHVLTGDDALSRIGTKHAALACEPHKYLHLFAESSECNEESLKMAEEYLVRVWTGALRKTSSRTFDQARLESHISSATPKALVQLPPTSSVIHNHIKRAFFVLRNVLNVFNDRSPELNAIDFGWFLEGDTMLPAKGLKPIPDDILVVCKCVGKCDTNRCKCFKVDVPCVVYCHTAHQDCDNR